MAEKNYILPDELNERESEGRIRLPALSQPTEQQARILLQSSGLGLIKPKFFNVGDTPDGDEANGNSAFLGTAVFDNVIFIAPNYQQLRQDEFAQNSAVTTELVTLSGNTYIPNPDNGRQGEETTVDKSFNAFRIDTVLIEVSQVRNIVTTAVAGKSGTVKEYISDGDYSIRMAGFIDSNNPNAAPTQDVGIFLSYLKAPVEIKIISDFLNIFSIASIVVTDYSFPQTEGRRNLQYFELNAISEQVLDKELKEQ